MPIYGYECGQCGHQFEVLQSISEEPMRTCPECMGPLHKKLYPVGVIFKGSGFYTTDYKGSKSGSNGSSGEGKSAGESKAESKPEIKPDKKSETKSDTKGSD